MGLRRTHAESREAQTPRDAGSQGVFLTSVGTAANWATTSSQWPVTADLACCTARMMSFEMPRLDAARLGTEAFRASPRQADLMIISERVGHKMALMVRDIYDRMTDPKWIVSMSVCTFSGGMSNDYAIIQRCDYIVPVDVYLPDCPSRPEMLISAVLEPREHVKRNHRLTKGTREAAARVAERAALAAPNVHAMKGLLV